jgi:hypothetical protein
MKKTSLFLTDFDKRCLDARQNFGDYTFKESSFKGIFGMP